EMRHTDIPPDSGLSVLIDSPDTGLCLLNDPRHHALHFFNHIEYDSLTLADEYFRDLGAGRNIHLPKNYFPGDCETRPPANQWRSHAHLLFANRRACLDRQVVATASAESASVNGLQPCLDDRIHRR
ncbi:hypothetical protein EWM58_14600, partial [Candidatus Erwinia dacicola]|nr:hypothetical protein [Candidatus Erwinia dacicola]